MSELSGLTQRPTPAPYPFGPTSVAAVLDDGLANHPDRIALIDGDRTWTWAELDGAVAEGAERLDLGRPYWFPPGNSAEKVISILATLRAGAIWLANETDPSKICAEFLTVEVRNTVQILDPLAPALIAFTSGTTGAPKAVVHSQHSMLAPGLVSAELEPPLPNERIGTPLSLSNANIFMLGPLSALLRGSTFVVLHSRYASALASEVSTHRVTRLFAVPTLAFDLCESNEVATGQLASLDRVVLGGAGAAPELLQTFTDRFGVRPTLSYGMSEAPTGVVRESLNDPIGSGRGFPLPHVEVAILDPDGQEMPTGRDGEICLRPASSGTWADTWTGTLGYLGELDRTKQLYRDGMLHTGDLGRLDTDGALSVTGRMTDLIIRGGKNIDPVALEVAARSSDLIAEAGVVGLANDRLGQLVGLALTANPDFVGADRLDLIELAMTIEEQSDAPIDAIVIVDEMPRNAMGKLDRKALARFFGPETRLR